MDLYKYLGKSKTLLQDAIRFLLILYFFGEKAESIEDSNLYYYVKAEYYIQKLDFLVRNPDYLCFEILTEVMNNRYTAEEKTTIKGVIKEIYQKKEPVIRRIPMQKFFYGAYERLDEVESFLTSVDFLRVRPVGSAQRVSVKYYYLTENGFNYITNELIPKCDYVQWYQERCALIQKYLGNLSASQLKLRQYEHETYSQTNLRSLIASINEAVNIRFHDVYGEDLHDTN